MEEEKNKRNLSTVSSSEVQQKNKELSSDEILEQILEKKKKKVQKRTTTTKKSNATKKVTVSKKSTSKEKKEMSDEELLEQILSKTKTKKAKQKTSSKKENKVKEIDSNINVKVEEKNIEKSKEEKADRVEVYNEEHNIIESPTLSDNDNNATKKTPEEDLIITREISFDEKLDLKNKKVLRELKKAIEDFDRLEDLEEIHSTVDKLGDTTKTNHLDEYNTEEINTNKKNTSHTYLDFSVDNRKEKLEEHVKYDTNQKQKLILIGSILLLFITLALIVMFYINNVKSAYATKEYAPSDVQDEIVDDSEDRKVYASCLSRIYDERDETDVIVRARKELTEYLEENYKTSVMYEDLIYGYTFSYNTSGLYYAASTIKALDALYIYTKASEGELDLDETIEYTSKYKWSSSKELSKYKYGQKVTLRNLVKYAVTVSDNSAHQMLVDYIGKSNLKEFGKELGATNTLVGSDNFGSINTKDAIIYMKAIYEFIINNGDLGEELNSYFVAAEQNDLELPDLGIQAAHKYGQYGSYYHDIGVVYDERPYVVAILTTEGSKNYEEKVKDINEHIYEFHKKLELNRERVCNSEVYGK